MKPKAIWANLAVQNLERTKAFYRTLGFKPNGNQDHPKDLVSFLFGDNEFVVHFFEKAVLEEFVQRELVDPTHANEIILTLSADTKHEVDIWADEVTNAGGTISSGPLEFGDGYYGFTFSDPDGHKWNVFHM